MEISKLKKAILIIVSVIILFVTYTYMRYINLDVYTVEQNGDIFSKNGVVFKFDGGLTSGYAGGDLKSEKVIGRVSGDGFLGRRILKLKNIDAQKSIALNGLMLQEVHTNENIK